MCVPEEGLAISSTWEAEKKCAQAKLLTTGRNGVLNHCPQEGITGGVEAWTPTPSPGPKPTAAR